jgi:hypothetical protein
VLEIERYALRSLVSIDGGATFAPEIDVAGTAGQAEVLDYRAVIAPDNGIHVALIVADPTGGLGLQYVRSDDMGATWTLPATLVTDDVPSFPLYKWDLDISANGSGVVAISYTSDQTGGTYLAFSLDGGSSWQEIAERVDLAGGAPFTFFGDSTVLADSSGNIHVAYTQTRESLPSIYVRRRSAAGTWSAEGPTSGLFDGPQIVFGQIGTDFIRPTPDDVVTNTPSDSIAPQVVWSGTEYGVAWQDNRDGNEEIYFALLDANGSSITGDIRITNDSANSSTPSLVWTGNQYGIAWQDSRDGNSEIYFVRLDSDGNRIGSDLRITDDPGTSTSPSLVWHADAFQYGLVWQDDRSGDDEIWLALISVTGAKVGPDVRVTNHAGTSAAPSLVPTDSGFGVAWQDDREGNDEIYFTQLNDAGSNIGPNLRVTADPAGSTRPALIWTESRYAIAWEDNRNGNEEIYFAQLDSHGDKIGSDIRVTNDPATSADPDLAFMSSLSLYAVFWRDDRDGNNEIYGKGIYESGLFSCPDYRFTNSSGRSAAPSILWNDDDSYWALVWEDLGASLPSFHARSPMLAEAADGSILLTYWVYGGYSVAVIRSTDAGQHYEPAFEHYGLSQYDVRESPTLTPAQGTPTVLLSYVVEDGLYSHRSSDYGATFPSMATVASPGADAVVASHSVVKGSGDYWAYAWNSNVQDTYISQTWDIYLRASEDDGVSWGAEQRVDSGTAGVEWRGDPGIVSTPGEFLVVYPDERGNSPPVDAWSINIYANSTLESPIGFGTDHRIDTDAGTAPPFSGYQEPTVATDGVNHVYVAFNAYSGPYATIFVAASADGGRTFGTPVAIGASASGQMDSHVPLLAATPDGHVYVVYQSDPTDLSGRQLRFNSSSDFGQTWQVSDELLGTVPQADVDQWGLRGTRVPGPSLAALPGGKVWVAWSNEQEIFLSRSSDGGLTFATRDIDQNRVDDDIAPNLCAQGDQVIVTWCGEAPALGLGMTVWALVSNDGGATFGPRDHLRPGASSNGWYPRIVCDGYDSAVVVWANNLGNAQSLSTSRYNGSVWSSDTEVPGPPDAWLYHPRLAFTDGALGQPENLLLVYQDYPEVCLNRSTDGGLTFSSYVRLDEAAPEPDNGSYWPRLAADGSDNVWISWLDYSANRSQPSIALRRSTDGGATLGPVIRVDKQVPGAFYNSYYFNSDTAALPEVGLFAWYAQNGTYTAGHLFLADDLGDDDTDGVNGSLDCDDGNAGVYPGAPQLCDGLNNDCDDPSWPEVPAIEADADSDGVRICDGDCDDGNPDTYPGALEVNDGLDNQCPGDLGDGVTDEISGECGFQNAADKYEFSWPPQSGAASYEVARSDYPDHSAGCTIHTTTDTYWVDGETPGGDVCFHYLVRSLTPHPGSWGVDSSNMERLSVCP